MPIIVGNTTTNSAITSTTLTEMSPQSYQVTNALRNTIRPALLLPFAQSGVVDPRITFTRASTATYFNSQGVLSTAANNTPRIDFDPTTGKCLGLLIEQQSANILLNSATLSTQSVTTTATFYTLSFYGTGTVALSGAYTGSLVGSGAFPTRSFLSFYPTSGTLTLTVTGTVSYAQLEVLGFPTSYIATTGSAVTRIADQAYLSLGSWYNPSASTLLIEAQKNTSSAGDFGGIAEIDDGSFYNRVEFYVYPSTTSLHFADNYTVNTVDADLTVGSYTLSTPYKAAGSITGALSTSGTIAASLNGATAVTGTTGNFPGSTLTRLSIGNLGGGNFMNGWIQRIAYYPVAFSSTQLQAMSS
jgi:hypothetical protein